MSANFKMLAKTFFGFEDLLENELKQLGAQEVEKGNRVVHFKGDKGFMYKANLSLRTALKILVPIYHCRVNSEHDLYQAAYDYPWEHHFTAKETFAIDSVVFGETFTHSLYVSQKVKDAIADSFRAKTGQRPSVNLKYPDVRINVHIAVSLYKWTEQRRKLLRANANPCVFHRYIERALLVLDRNMHMPMLSKLNSITNQIK